MATNEELKARVTELERENSELLDENDALREQLTEAQRNQKPQPNTRPATKEPSFGMSEGERTDLEETGRSVSPFTGKVTTAKGK